MGLGALFTRNIQYVATDTQTGATATYEIITDGSPGMYAAWDAIHYQGGMGVPGAWRAALLLSDLLGSVPWHGYTTGADGLAERLDPDPLLLEQPAPPDTRMTTFSSWGLDLIWHGNAVGLIAARGERGEPSAVIPVPARLVDVERIGPARQQSPDLPVGTVLYWIGGRWWPATEVIHIKGPCEPGALRGTGVIENHLHNALELAKEQARQAGNLADAAVPTGTLKSLNPDLTKNEADAIKAAWMRSQRDRTVAVLNASTEFEALAWNPTETQLLEARRFSLHEIALIFGLDPSWLGAAQTSRVYSNIEGEAINLIKFSLGGHLARFEQALSAAMPPGEWVQANLDAVLRADTLTRYQAHEIGIRAGFLTDDEARQLENRRPLTPEQRAALTERRAAAAPAPATPEQPTPDEEENP